MNIIIPVSIVLLLSSRHNFKITSVLGSSNILHYVPDSLILNYATLDYMPDHNTYLLGLIPTRYLPKYFSIILSLLCRYFKVTTLALKQLLFKLLCVDEKLFNSSFFLKLVQCQPRLNREIRQIVVEAVRFNHT